MAAKDGSKTGGRAKGTPNKRDTLDAVAVCREANVDVFKEMLTIATLELDTDKRFDKFEKCAPYLYPKRKALEVQIKSEIETQAEEFAKLPKTEQITLLEAEAKRLKGEA